MLEQQKKAADRKAGCFAVSGEITPQESDNLASGSGVVRGECDVLVPEVTPSFSAQATASAYSAVAGTSAKSAAGALGLPAAFHRKVIICARVQDCWART